MYGLRRFPEVNIHKEFIDVKVTGCVPKIRIEVRNFFQGSILLPGFITGNLIKIKMSECAV